MWPQEQEQEKKQKRMAPGAGVGVGAGACGPRSSGSDKNYHKKCKQEWSLTLGGSAGGAV